MFFSLNDRSSNHIGTAFSAPSRWLKGRCPQSAATCRFRTWGCRVERGLNFRCLKCQMFINQWHLQWFFMISEPEKWKTYQEIIFIYIFTYVQRGRPPAYFFKYMLYIHRMRKFTE